MDAKIVNTCFQAIPIRILLPVVLTVALFVGTIFLLILPILKDRMLNDKREMIRELTETAWSVLDGYHKKEISGQMSPADARRRAVEELRRLRYGPESKDYFWINDLHPYLVMHPYRPDLEGNDISGFSDSNGKKLFVEFVKTVKNRGAGYVDYQWQWKDDPQRIVPKISYVKGFDPWGWIIGTGIYVEDVRAEIAAIHTPVPGTALIGFSEKLPTIKQATDLLVAEAMRRSGGNQSVAAGLLGITQQAMSKRLKKKDSA